MYPAVAIFFLIADLGHASEGVSGMINVTKSTNAVWKYGLSVGTTCDCTDMKTCGPDKWQECPGYGECNKFGTQTPINVVTKALEPSMTLTTNDLVFNTVDTDGACAGQAAYFVSDVTTQVTFASNCAHNVVFKGKQYGLKQIHYHSPSEHTMDGGYFPLEAHHVHISSDGQILVIGVFVTVGTQVSEPASSYLSQVLGKMPDPKASPNANFVQIVSSGPTGSPYPGIQPLMSESFVHYNGSLTTPPCSTVVTWILAQKAAVITQGALDQYRRIINEVPDSTLAEFDDVTGSNNAVPPWNDVVTALGAPVWNTTLGVNARPVQPLGKRTVALIGKVLATTKEPVASSAWQGASLLFAPLLAALA